MNEWPFHNPADDITWADYVPDVGFVKDSEVYGLVLDNQQPGTPEEPAQLDAGSPTARGADDRSDNEAAGEDQADEQRALHGEPDTEQDRGKQQKYYQ